MESIYTSPPVYDAQQSLARWIEYLDLLSSHKVNMVRFYPWSFVWADKKPWQGAGPWPYASLDPVAYDLDAFSEPYWDTVTSVARAAAERGIIFEYILFEGWVNSNVWDKHPWNAQRGGPISDRVRFFDLSIGRNRYLQEKYVQKAIDELGHLPNVLFEIANELAANRYSKAWATHWVSYIKSREPGLLVTISEPSWHFGPELATEAYWEWQGIDVVSAHETKGDLALYDDYVHDRFVGYWERGLAKPLMVNEWCGVGSSLDYADERKLFWTVLASGGHAVRSCHEPFWETPSLDWLKYLADFLDGTVTGQPVVLAAMRPADQLSSLVGVPLGFRVFTLANPGQEYLIYIRAPQDSKVLVYEGLIRVELPAGQYRAVWYDPKIGEIAMQETTSPRGTSVKLRIPPFQEDIALHLLRVK
jgi:hypothetical protein